MKSNGKKILWATLLVIVVFNVELIAQREDFRIWFDLKVEKKLTRKLHVEGRGAFRLNENIREVGSYYGDFGIGYKLTPNFRAELHYRFSGKSNDEGYFHKRNRYYVDLIYKIKTGTPFFVSLRGRFQKQYTDIYSSEDGFNPANTFRLAVTPTYKIKQYQPYFRTEIFYLYDNSDKYFNRIRYRVGSQYEFNKRNSLDVFYMIQQELHAENPTRAFVLGFSYKFIL
jgi:hypothetical protein